MVDLLLATCADLPAGEPGAVHLDRALAARGVTAGWAVWDDPAVDWSSAGLVAVRSTWDYTGRAREFLAWADAVAATTRLLNGARVIHWNHDKRYLTELGDLPVVPTRVADGGAALAATVADRGPTVVKPRVGASGVGLVVVDGPDDPGLAVLDQPAYPPHGGGWIVQPLVQSIRSHGEVSVFVVDGSPCVQVDKRPGGREIRVHEEFGGSSRVADLDPDCAGLAVAAMRAAEQRCGRPLDYGRVDMMWLAGRWAVGEIELIEPGLYLDVTARAAAPFADLVVRRLAPSA